MRERERKNYEGGDGGRRRARQGDGERKRKTGRKRQGERKQTRNNLLIEGDTGQIRTSEGEEGGGRAKKASIGWRARNPFLFTSFPLSLSASTFFTSIRPIWRSWL